MEKTLVIHMPGLADIHQSLRGSGEWILGSSDECDIPVRMRGVSRKHLRLTADPAGLRFEDLTSTNGTFLDGVPALSGVLKTGRILQIGECTLFLADTKTEALLRPAETTELPVITTIDLKLPTLTHASESAGKRLPILSLVGLMERVARAGATATAMQGICEVFAESLGCNAAKCFRQEKSGTSLQAVHGDFPADRFSQELTSACLFLPHPTFLDLGGDGEKHLLGVCVPVPMESARVIFLGIVPASEDPLRKRFEAMLVTPVILRFLLRWVEEAQRDRTLIQELAEQVRTMKSAGEAGPDGIEPILGRSPSLVRALDIADLTAPSDIPVLLLGATGTGKELFARRIHARSKRAERSFVAVNCSSIPETLLESELFGAERGAYTGSERRRKGFFEEASGGTLFLDEIGDLPLALQPKLLRVLEEKRIYPLGSTKSVPVDVRILAASNHDLRTLVEEGRFRGDLYYRLAGLVIDLPPLSLRMDDLPILATAFMERANRELGRAVHGFQEEAFHALQKHTWPGNVRELLAMVRRLVLTAEGPVVTAPMVRRALKGERGAPGDGVPDTWSLDWQTAKAAFEREFFSRRLKASQGSLSALARELGISRPSLYEKLRKLGIHVTE